MATIYSYLYIVSTFFLIGAFIALAYNKKGHYFALYSFFAIINTYWLLNIEIEYSWLAYFAVLLVFFAFQSLDYLIFSRCHSLSALLFFSFSQLFRWSFFEYFLSFPFLNVVHFIVPVKPEIAFLGYVQINVLLFPLALFISFLTRFKRFVLMILAISILTRHNNTIVQHSPPSFIPMQTHFRHYERKEKEQYLINQITTYAERDTPLTLVFPELFIITSDRNYFSKNSYLAKKISTVLENSKITVVCGLKLSRLPLRNNGILVAYQENFKFFDKRNYILVSEWPIDRFLELLHFQFRQEQRVFKNFELNICYDGSFRPFQNKVNYSVLITEEGFMMNSYGQYLYEKHSKTYSAISNLILIRSSNFGSSGFYYPDGYVDYIRKTQIHLK